MKWADCSFHHGLKVSGGNARLSTKPCMIVISLKGTPLPVALYKPSSVRVDNSFVLVGGYSDANGGPSDTVFAYVVEDRRWQELQRLTRPRAAATAMMINKDLNNIFPDC